MYFWSTAAHSNANLQLCQLTAANGALDLSTLQSRVCGDTAQMLWGCSYKPNVLCHNWTIWSLLRRTSCLQPAKVKRNGCSAFERYSKTSLLEAETGVRATLKKIRLQSTSFWRENGVITWCCRFSIKTHFLFQPVLGTAFIKKVHSWC